MAQKNFSTGDRVVHADRPEWGVGAVIAVMPLAVNGQSTSRLRIRFERAGVKTLVASEAPLRQANGDDVAAPDAASPAGWLEQLEREPLESRMVRLPERAVDPFASLLNRLRFTASLYRFEAQGASLLDWAAAQAGLADPLSHFSRHDLEILFNRFAMERDKHFASLLNQLRRTSPSAIAKALADAPPAAKQAMRRHDKTG